MSLQCIVCNLSWFDVDKRSEPCDRFSQFKTFQIGHDVFDNPVCHGSLLSFSISAGYRVSRKGVPLRQDPPRTGCKSGKAAPVSMPSKPSTRLNCFTAAPSSHVFWLQYMCESMVIYTKDKKSNSKTLSINYSDDNLHFFQHR